MEPPFLHAAHQVRETFAALEWISWLAIGVGAGALVVTWGRIVAWVRTPDVRGPAVRRWGIDDEGLYFEVAPAGAGGWSAEGPEGQVIALSAAADNLLRASAPPWEPVAVLSSDGHRLPL